MARYNGYARPKDSAKTMKRLLHYMGIYKWSVLLVGLLVCISSLANLLGTYMLKPVINTYILPGDIPGLIRTILLMALMYGAGAFATLGYNQLMVITCQKIVGRIRRDLFEHTQKLPLSYFDAHTHGELMSRFTNDVDTLTEALNNSFTLLIQSFIVVSGTIIMLVVLNLRLSLIVIAFLLLMFLFIQYNGKRSRKYFIEQQKYLGSINGFVEEMVAGAKVEKIFNHEEQDFAEFCRRNETLRQSATKAMSYSGMMVPTIVSLSYFNYAVSACVGGMFVLSGLMDLGSLASYLVYVRQSAMPMNQFTQQINFLLAALSGAERIFEMMDEEPEPDEGDVTLTEAADGTLAWKVPENGSFSLVPLKGDVRFYDVVFGYTPEKKILNGISLYAKPGQKIAFVGSTGAGKTTIINLINRFYEIQSGTITYDGLDIRRIKKDDLRRSLSMVIQDTHLFTGTIMDNIRYGRLDATDEEVIAAAKTVRADEFIREMEDGYYTQVNERGSRLSQGQRQLVAFARTLLSNPKILVLDEATSSIDAKTERLVQEGLNALLKGRTSFIIAHRLSTIKNCDRILYISNKGIAEMGNHQQLLDKHGYYYHLYTAQLES